MHARSAGRARERACLLGGAWTRRWAHPLTTGPSVETTSSKSTKRIFDRNLRLKALNVLYLRTNLRKTTVRRTGKDEKHYFDNYPGVTKKEKNELVPGDHWVGETTFRRKSAATASPHRSLQNRALPQRGTTSRLLQFQLQSLNHNGDNLLQNQIVIHYFHHYYTSRRSYAATQCA